MQTHRVSFNRACISEKGLDYVREATTGGRISGDGPFTKRCSELLESESGASRVLLTSSCTHALELAALLLDLQPGDEVIMSSFTFVSTANAFILRGARPVFVDIRPDTLNMDEKLIEPLITNRTRAIVPVHYAGVGCEMDAIVDVASSHGISVVEDNAQGLFGRYKGRPLGSFGCVSAVSFHETKNITCGEGGALFINDESLVEHAEILREKGTNRAQFLRGQIDKYTWRSIGSSYLLSDILAAVLLAQLEERESIQQKRKEIWEFYEAELTSWADANGVSLPTVPEHCEPTHHIFYLILPTAESRTRFIENLSRAGIRATSHYEPLHTSPMGATWGYAPGDLPVTERVAGRLVRLPLHLGLTKTDLERVCHAIHRLQGGA